MVNRDWKNDDTIELQLPMKFSVRVWAKNKDAVSVDYGPLSFSLAIKERWQKYGDRIANWPEWEVFPDSPWNYGLVLDARDPAKSFSVSRRSGPLPPQPFTPDTAPIASRRKARKIPQWQAGPPQHAVGKLQPSPAKSDEPVEHITLIPMGAARLRISCFPTVSTTAEAHEWVVTPQPRPAAYKPTASHCFENDTVNAMCDGLDPASSNDQDIPRLTWWDHRGTAEWAQYDFDSPKRVAAVSVYWFDDTGIGSCRVPDSWRLLYRDGDEWRPVSPRGEFGVLLNCFNRVEFDAIETTALRLEVQLRPRFSGGILEWKLQ